MCFGVKSLTLTLTRCMFGPPNIGGSLRLYFWTTKNIPATLLFSRRFSLKIPSEKIRRNPGTAFRFRRVSHLRSRCDLAGALLTV